MEYLVLATSPLAADVLTLDFPGTVAALDGFGETCATLNDGSGPFQIWLVIGGVVTDYFFARPALPPAHACASQCDGCHSLENCVPATHRLGDLLLCDTCHRTVKSGGVDALAWAL